MCATAAPTLFTVPCVLHRLSTWVGGFAAAYCYPSKANPNGSGMSVCVVIIRTVRDVQFYELSSRVITLTSLHRVPLRRGVVVYRRRTPPTGRHFEFVITYMRLQGSTVCECEAFAGTIPHSAGWSVL